MKTSEFYEQIPISIRSPLVLMVEHLPVETQFLGLLQFGNVRIELPETLNQQRAQSIPVVILCTKQLENRRLSGSAPESIPLILLRICSIITLNQFAEIFLWFGSINYGPTMLKDSGLPDPRRKTMEHIKTVGIHDKGFEETYTAHIQRNGTNWLGWIPDIPEVKCEESTEKMLGTLEKNFITR